MCGFDPHSNGRTAVMDGTIPKWENNIVKYMFNDSSVTKEDKDTFAEAVKQIINANHCLKFTEISSAPHGEQYMLIKRQGACGSGCFCGSILWSWRIFSNSFEFEMFMYPFWRSGQYWIG